jgi:hypothetical protein
MTKDSGNEIEIRAAFEGLVRGLSGFLEHVEAVARALPPSGAAATVALECARVDHLEPLLRSLAEVAFGATGGEDEALRLPAEEPAETADLELRRARIGDEPALARLARGGPPFEGELEPFRLGLERALGTAVLWVAAERPGGRLAGFFRATAGRTARITHCTVVPELCADRGLERRLLLAGAADLIAAGATRIGGFVHPADPLFVLLRSLGGRAHAEHSWIEATARDLRNRGGTAPGDPGKGPEP